MQASQARQTASLLALAAATRKSERRIVQIQRRIAAPASPSQGGAGVEGGGEDCAICLESLHRGAKALVCLPCGHTYHLACEQSPTKSRCPSRLACPICRAVCRR